MNRTITQLTRCRLGTRRNKGTTTLEVALVAPILLGILIGSIEIGWVYLVSHTMQQAAFAGARTLAFKDATDEEAILAANEYLDALNYPFSMEMGQPEGEPRVVFQVSIPYQSIALAGNPLGILPSSELVVRATLKKEGGV